MQVTVDLERKYGLVPSGRFSNNTALKLFNGLLKDFNTITIIINEDIDSHRRKWYTYRLLKIEGTDCILQEIKYKLPKEATPEKVLSGEITSIPVLQNNIKRMNACDICQMKDTYMAFIEVTNE